MIDTDDIDKLLSQKSDDLEPPSQGPGSTDDIDRLLSRASEGDEPSFLQSKSRAELEAGAGLEIDDGFDLTDAVEGSDIDSDSDAPTWLKAGKQEAVVAEEFYPEADTPGDSKPLTWVEIDADVWDDKGEPADGVTTGTVEETAVEEAADAPKKRVVVHESQKTRRALLIIAVIAGAAALTTTYMSTHGIGPFAPAPLPPVEEPPVSESEIESVDWASAGEGFEELYALIAEQTRVAAGTTNGEGPGQGDLMPIDSYESFSNSSEQGEGVIDADIVKTDGEYMYSINSKNLLITRIDGSNMSLESKIPQPSADEKQVYFEMFVSGDRLIAVRQGLNKSALQLLPGMEDTEVPTASIWYPFGSEITDTSIDIFDISDRAAPEKLHTLSQSGAYMTGRMVGDHLYLISTYYGDVPKMKPTDPRTFVPLFARDGEQFTPRESDIIIPPGSGWPCYTVISGIDAMGAGDFVSLKAVYGDVGMVYMSSDAVYLARMSFEETREAAGTLPPLEGAEGPGLDYYKYTNWSETLITKMAVDSGNVAPGAQVTVPGYVPDQFSLDVYKGALRLVTTVDHNVWYGFSNSHGSFTVADWGRLPVGSMEAANALYILDGSLGRLGGIDDIAPGERVNASRFSGDYAYFTTYNQTNPIVSVDLRDPKAPAVAGSIKMEWLPGNLLPYSDGKLFGLGRKFDLSTGRNSDLTLRMFDNSDPAALKELHTLAITDGGFTELNPGAIFVSADNSFVAFPADGKYLVYSYSDQAGFKRVAEIGFGAGEDIRGVIVGGILYIVGSNDVFAYKAGGGFDRIGSLSADRGAGAASRLLFFQGFPVN